MKPVVIYVDDEPHNLTVFEAALPEDWEIKVFDNPLTALDQMTKLDPWIIVSDQRMPGMMGVNFLEIAKKTHPDAKRVLITGYSEEDLIIDSVRKAGVHDYIRKPWDVDDLHHRMSQVVETYQLETDLKNKKQMLEQQNLELKSLMAKLEGAKIEEESLRKELEAWAPPFILSALKNPDVSFPMRRDLALITFDMIDSSKTHDIFVDGRPIRSLILKAFSESVIRHGGWRESHAGDSAYAHFGLLDGNSKPAESALAVASEFRTFLRNFSIKHGVSVECGIGLHVAKNVLVNVHTAEIETPAGRIIQKSFDSTSSDVDLVHRIESLLHMLPGSNIAMSEAFIAALATPISGLQELGLFKLKGQKEPCRLYAKISDRVASELVDFLKSQALSLDPKQSA